MGTPINTLDLLNSYNSDVAPVFAQRPRFEHGELTLREDSIIS